MEHLTLCIFYKLKGTCRFETLDWIAAHFSSKCNLALWMRPHPRRVSWSVHPWYITTTFCIPHSAGRNLPYQLVVFKQGPGGMSLTPWSVCALSYTLSFCFTHCTFYCSFRIADVDLASCFPFNRLFLYNISWYFCLKEQNPMYKMLHVITFL